IQDLYLGTNQLQLASDLDKELVKEAPKDVIVRVDHGRLLMLQGKLTDAVSDLQRAVADSADSAQAHYFLGLAHWPNGELGQAAAALQHALKVTPGFSPALQQLVRLSLAQNDLRNARTYAQELVQKYPADPTDRELLATVLGRQGQISQAEAQELVANQL